MTSVVNLCRQSENDWYRVYLIRKISSQYGVEFALKLLRDKEMSWLFPKEALLKVSKLIVSISFVMGLIRKWWNSCVLVIKLSFSQREVGPSIDQFLVCGEDYKAFRNAITTVMLRGQFDQLDETYKVTMSVFFFSIYPCVSKLCIYICLLFMQGCRTSPQLKTVYLLLALYREVTTLYREADVSLHPKPEVGPRPSDLSQSILQLMLREMFAVEYSNTTLLFSWCQRLWGL